MAICCQVLLAPRLFGRVGQLCQRNRGPLFTCNPFLSAMLFASSTPSWPQGFDRVLTGAYLLLVISLPLLGYLFMARDFRRYLRSLRRALVTVARAAPAIPTWTLGHSPVFLKGHRCLKALDLSLPCSEADVTAAYRDMAKTLHPDRGGNLQKFLQLQRNFEQALRLVRSQSA
jgi:hypothetical protein